MRRSSSRSDADRDAAERAAKGELASYRFWTEHRPEVAELHRARAHHYYSGEGLRAHRVVGLCGAIHEYAVQGFADGVGHEMRAARFHGAGRQDMLDTLSVAFIHAGHAGMYAVDRVARTELESFLDPPAPDRFPDGWESIPEALEAGLDGDDPEASHEDLDRLLGWYERVLGEVPRHVSFLAAHRPGLLKAYRLRWERAIAGGLPTQMLPYLLLRHSAARGWTDGIRENVLLGRALGMTRAQLLDAILPAVLTAGAEVLGTVDAAVGDLLADTP